MNWIKPGTVLKGDLVELIPLSEIHFDELIKLAGDKRIWDFIPVDMSSPEQIRKIFSRALIERDKGTHFPFVIYYKKEKKLIGSTRLMEIFPLHNKLEIGWTWLHPDYWATAVNLECKLLLLTFCFEELGVIRVQLKTDENNIRSRRAIQKIGAKFEGILRNDMIRENGTIRNSVYFSIIDNEWENVRQNLQNLLNTKIKETEI
jgi:RimJ/RimL family protein N-acetyltransferase